MSTAKCLLQCNNITLVLHFSRSLASQKTFVKTMESKNIVSCSRTKYITTQMSVLCVSQLCSLFLLINVMLSVMLKKLCILHIQSIRMLFMILTVCQLFL